MSTCKSRSDRGAHSLLTANSFADRDVYMRYIGGGVGHGIPYRDLQGVEGESEEDESDEDDNDDSTSTPSPNAEDNDEGEADGASDVDDEGSTNYEDDDDELGPEDGEDGVYEEWDTSDV